MSLFEELKRRNVFRVGLAYVVGAWLLLQLTDVLSELLDLPAQVGPMVVTAVLIGFPVVLLVAWVYELTPQGIKRESEIDRTESITGETGKKLNVAIVAMLSLALAYFIWESRFSGDRPGNAPATVASNEGPENTTAAPEREVSPRSIAVLPFDNRSAQSSDEYFVDGIHDDLLTNLSRIGSLKVISRTTVSRYADSDKTLPEIADELGVATIMEGAVQRAGDQVRINVQLIDAQTDEHLWAEIFDRELTAENLFSIQSEISESIADALQATLTPEEQQRIDALPTENLAAYDAYLQGRQLLPRRNAGELARAEEAFRKAVTLDPDFALAWVGLADAHALGTTYSGRRFENSFELREEAIDRALSLDDQLGEAYTSLANLNQQKGRVEEAEAAFRKALELSPNYATTYHWYSRLLAFETNRAEEARAMAQRAVELDPASPVIIASLGGIYSHQGLYSLAEQQLRRLTELYPNAAIGYASLGAHTFLTKYDHAEALRLLNKGVEVAPEDPSSLFSMHSVLTDVGDDERALAVEQVIRDRFGDPETMDFIVMYTALVRTGGEGVTEQISTILSGLDDPTSWAAYLAFASAVNGDLEVARRLFLLDQPGWLDRDAWDGLLARQKGSCILSWVLAETGDEALGAELTQATADYFDGPMREQHASVETLHPELCYLLLGDTERALATMEKQLEQNFLHQWQLLHRLPHYDALRLEPRFLDMQAEAERRRQKSLEAVLAVKINLGEGRTL